MTRVLVVASLTGFAAACGGDNSGPTDDNDTPPDTAPSEDGVTRLRMTNQSSTSAWFIYIRQCGNENWGPDQLGSSNVLSPGESASWTTDNPGCYDIRAISEPGAGQKEALWTTLNVAEEQTTQVNIQNGDWQ
jgi:hypothetical protein